MNNELNRFELERKHPVRTFEIWLTPDGQLRGYEKFDVSYPESAKGYGITHECFGQTACIFIVSNDKHIDRKAAINFASHVAMKKLRTFRISMNEINGDKREC